MTFNNFVNKFNGKATDFDGGSIVTMEVTSIFENLDNLGVPIPKVISDRVNNLKDEIEGDDKNGR